MNPTLPDKPSELIRLAIRDLEKIEKTEGYSVDMSVWHKPVGDAQPICHVCLAGSVMASTIGVDRKNHTIPNCLSDLVTCGKLYALNEFRLGSVGTGLHIMGIVKEGVENHLAVTPYRQDPAAFKRDMLAMASMLEGHGL